MHWLLETLASLVHWFHLRKMVVWLCTDVSAHNIVWHESTGAWRRVPQVRRSTQTLQCLAASLYSLLRIASLAFLRKDFTSFEAISAPWKHKRTPCKHDIVPLSTCRPAWRPGETDPPSCDQARLFLLFQGRACLQVTLKLALQFDGGATLILAGVGRREEGWRKEGGGREGGGGGGAEEGRAGKHENREPTQELSHGGYSTGILVGGTANSMKPWPCSRYKKM